MITFMKRFLLITLILGTFCLMTGCGDKKENRTDEDKRTQEKKGSVYFLNNREECEGVYNEIAKAYEKKTGVKVTVKTIAEDDYEDELEDELTGAPTPSLLSIPGVQSFARWEDYCDDISDSELVEYLEDPTLAISDSQGVYAIPVAVEGYGIAVNEEIFDRYLQLDTKGTDIQSLEQIRNFDTLKEVVADIHTHREEIGIKGVFAGVSMEDDSRLPWVKYLAGAVLAGEFADNENYDNEILAAMASATIDFRDSDCFQNVFELYANYSTTRKKNFEKVTEEDALREFATGECVMLQAGSFSWNKMAEMNGSVLNPDKVKMLPIYLGTEEDASRGICIGTEDYLAVNAQAKSDDKAAALDFLKWLYGTAEGKKYVLNGLDFIAPFNTFSPDEMPGNPLAKEVARYMGEEGWKNVPWVFTAFPRKDFYEETGDDLEDYVEGEIDFSEFSQRFREHWKKESVATTSTKGYNG